MNHYTLLRTIEKAYGLPPLGQAATERPLSRIWKTWPPLWWFSFSLMPVSRLPGASDGIQPQRMVARRASRSELSPQSNPRHRGHIRADPSAGVGRAARHRRSAAGLVAAIISLGLIGLCLRALPTVLTDSNPVTEIPGLPMGITVARSSAESVSPAATASGMPSAPAGTSGDPVKSQAKRSATSVRQVEVPGSGPGTYKAAKKAIRSTSSHGSVIRYDVRVEDGLSIDADEAAVLIQGVLDDARSWRGTRRWRFELAPAGKTATLHAYIVTPTTTDRLCAPYLTRGEVSCQNGDRVVLNAKRWLLGADSYGSDLTNYRRYLVNHEFGHTLGKRHVNCPAPGRRAPIMLQQTKGLQGCRKNPWPLASEG